MLRFAYRVPELLRHLLPGRRWSDLRWWERMADRMGSRAVLHHGHSEEEMAQVTEWQRGILFPLLQQQLRGDEGIILDYGCGPGRFTPGLAELLDGRAIGVDPIRTLLDRAPRHRRVEYRWLRGAQIPLADDSVDVVWICLVLMCITDERALQRTIREIERVLRPGGLLFLVENTHERPDLKHLRYRSAETYRELFPSIGLRQVGEYHDLGERISVLAGRRQDTVGDERA